MSKRYPDGVFSMLFIQMFSLVSFAMLFSLLTLYAVHVLHFSDQKAYDVSAAFNAQAFATAVLGGYVGNRFLGYRLAFIFSGILAIVGFSLLLSKNLFAFYYGLAIYTLAQGIMVPAMFVLLGMLYEQDSPYRDSGFILAYIGMNIGSFLASVAAGPISEHYGYWWAFFIGLIFTVLTLVNYLLFHYKLKSEKLTRLTHTHAEKISLQDKIIGGAVIFFTIPLLAYLMEHPNWDNFVLTSLGILSLLVMILITLRQTHALQRNRMLVFIFLNIASLIFWALYLLMPTVMPLFTERNVQREVFHIVIPTASFVAINPLLIILLGPCLSILWLRLAERNVCPSTATKFTIGFTLMALGCIVLALGTDFHKSVALVSWIWVMLSYFLQTSGELFVAPIGLAMVGVLAPRNYEGLMMGIWQLSTGVAGVLTGHLAKLVSFTQQTSVQPLLTNPHYAHLFISCASLMTGTVILTLLFLPYLNSLIKEKVHD